VFCQSDACRAAGTVPADRPRATKASWAVAAVALRMVQRLRL